MSNRLVAAFVICCLAFSPAAMADVDSGPAVGEAVPALKVYATTGASAGKEIAADTERAGKKTVFVFIRGDQWSRPMARFLKVLDGNLKKSDENAAVVAVWLTEDVENMKTHLPRVQESVKFESTTLSVYEKDKNGPDKWSVNSEAHLTAVVSDGKKVTKTFGFVSVNETLVPEVEKALKAE